VTRAALKNAEERLRSATLAGDLPELDTLLSDRVVIVGPDGGVIEKDDHLELHRSGRQRISHYDCTELRIELVGDHVGVVAVRVRIAGDRERAPFAGSFRFTRTYAREAETWRIVSMHASPCGEAAALP